MKRSNLVVAAAVFSLGILSWPCRAQPLGTAFTYQGELRAGGVPATGLHDLRFRLYDAATGGTQVGLQVCLDNVSVADGRFTVSLDFGAQFAGQQRFLEIEVRADTGQDCANAAGFTVLGPRQPLTGAPHALFALNAGQLDGQPSSFYLNAANLTSGTLADARLSSNVPRLNTAQTFVGVQTFSAAPSFTAVGAPFTVSSSTLVANLNADLLDGLDSTAFLRSGVSGAGGDLAGTYPNPMVVRLQTRPVSASAPTSGQVLKWDGSAWAPAVDGLTLPFDGSANATGSTAFRVENTATSGASDGILGQSASTSGMGVVGWATATSGSNIGVWGLSSSTSGTGVRGVATATSGGTYGVWGQSASTSGYGVFGWATATSGTTYGVRGESDSTSGRGVFGWATNTGNGTNYGGYFRSDGPFGIAVYAWATATSGSTWGVLGRTDSSDSSASGVFGVEPSGGAGHAVYALGTLAATGTKSFQIDHPLTPETHYLNHFCAEGPEPYNIYRGTVITDELGYATITLPDYFESINRDPTYHLTVVDDGEQHVFVLAKVVRKIKDNQFTIRTSAPNVEVSWRVEAVRHDRYVQQYGFQTVQEKEDEIKGKYVQPELYGKPRERGIHYRPDMERPAPAAPPREQADLAVTQPAPGRP